MQTTVAKWTKVEKKQPKHLFAVIGHPSQDVVHPMYIIPRKVGMTKEQKPKTHPIKGYVIMYPMTNKEVERQTVHHWSTPQDVLRDLNFPLSLPPPSLTIPLPLSLCPQLDKKD